MAGCLAGNSIHADKTFLVKEMPEVSCLLVLLSKFLCQPKVFTLLLICFLRWHETSWTRSLSLSLFAVSFQLIDHLHYRLVDVSTVKELVRRFYGPEKENFWNKGKGSHRALDDIRDSIEELKFYRENFFKGKDEIAKWEWRSLVS